MQLETIQEDLSCYKEPRIYRSPNSFIDVISLLDLYVVRVSAAKFGDYYVGSL